MSATEYAKNLPMRGNVTSGMERISDMPRARVIQSAAQSITPSGTNTAIVFDLNAADIDTDGMWSTSALDRLTVRTAGLYDVKYGVRWATSAAGTLRQAFIAKNGSTSFQWAPDSAPVANVTLINANATSMDLNAGDYLQIVVQQDTGGALSTSTGGGGAVAAELILCLIST